jgi:creatinine amidohydrolase/Fe(II)-dependent formamide hydrolase-like protein
MRMQLAEMSWKDVSSYLKHRTTVLIPVRSLEQHGPHLPLATDAIIAEAVAERAAEKMGVPVAPTIPYGFSIEHIDFPGTASVNPETLLSNLLSLLPPHNLSLLLL